jgi:hypothetical protein
VLAPFSTSSSFIFSTYHNRVCNLGQRHCNSLLRRQQSIELATFTKSAITHKPAVAMEPSNYEHIPDEPRYIDFQALPPGTVRDGKPVLNRWSHFLTKDHDFPGAQVWCPEPLGATINTGTGHAVRSRCAQSRDDEERTACWNLYSVVGRKPLQVSISIADCSLGY